MDLHAVLAQPLPNSPDLVKAALEHYLQEFEDALVALVEADQNGTPLPEISGRGECLRSLSPDQRADMLRKWRAIGS